MEDGDAARESRREEIRQENAGLLEEFATWLDREDVGRKTIDAHLVNVDLFVNQCLCNGDSPAPATEGLRLAGTFLGDWLPRNAMWIDADAVRRHADSLRHFYAFMHRSGRIGEPAYEALVKEIRAGLPQWVAGVADADEPLADDEEDPDADRGPEIRVRRSRPKGPREPKPSPRGNAFRRRPDRSAQPPE